jgi:hypothetical protein
MQLPLKISFLLFSFFLFGQNTNAQIEKGGALKPNKALKNKAPQTIEKTNLNIGSLDREDLEGTFVVDTVYILKDDQLKDVPCKVMETDTVYLSQKSLITKGIEQIDFIIYDVEPMNTEDYLYRALTIYPEDIPENLPNKVVVHKSDFKHTYGFGLLPDGRIIMPYAGRLIYLKPLN